MNAVPLSDRLAIEDLFVRYTCAIDAGDVDTLVDCFTEDGSLESPAVGAYAGPAAIRAFAERFAAFRRKGARLRHAISNLIVAVQGDCGHATCYLLVALTRDGTSRFLPPAQYDCELSKTDGAWRFQRRMVRHDCEYTLDGI